MGSAQTFLGFLQLRCCCQETYTSGYFDSAAACSSMGQTHCRSPLLLHTLLHCRQSCSCNLLKQQWANRGCTSCCRCSQSLRC
jgi:hypothetical protein